MKKTIELELAREAARLENSLSSLEGLRSKLNNLQFQIDCLEAGVSKSLSRIEEIGSRGPRRDGVAETPEEQLRREQFNRQLLEQKLQTTKQYLDLKNPKIWAAVEANLPDHLRGIGI